MNEKTTLWVMVVLIWSAFMTNCSKETGPASGEDLTIVVEADRSKISAEEKRLKSQLGEFEKKRSELRDEKEKLMQAKMEMKDKDRVQAQRLKEMEKRLWEKEKAMWQKEAELEAEQSSLANQKNNLLQKVVSPSVSSGSKGTVDRERSIVGREKTLAQRESDLAAREKDLALREKALAQREANLADNLSKMSSLMTPVVSQNRDKNKRVTRKQADNAFKKINRAMQKKGLLWDDLPPEVSNAGKELYAAKKKGDYARVMDLVSQIEVALSATVVDSGFIDRKFARLNDLISKNPPKNKNSVSKLLRKVTLLVGDGKYQSANLALNRIFALVRS